MSLEVVIHVMGRNHLTADEKLALIFLGDNANPDGEGLHPLDYDRLALQIGKIAEIGDKNGAIAQTRSLISWLVESDELVVDGKGNYHILGVAQ